MAMIRRKPAGSGTIPGTVPAAVPVGEIPDSPAPTLIAPSARAVTAIANQANAALGLVGITGAGKTSLATTAIEEGWETYHKVTLFYASDLGGWGSKLLSLIRLGICRVWYIRSHRFPFETMELASRGYWPVRMLDYETGMADPGVELIAPRLERFTLICPHGHAVATYPTHAAVTAAQAACPTCGQITTALNAARIDKSIVRPGFFKDVGHRVYDSMTQMCEWGQSELREKSAKGELPAGSSGGAALGAADALREGSMAFGTGSKAQYGFMQDRVPVWISNIRNIPDQILPPVLTFGVERSKGDDESGGIPIMGPKISGNARTSSVPGWLGNCLYVAKEPGNPVEYDAHGNVIAKHRLWLTNHVDPRDPSATPIVAKHRGEPLGMPDYLEDPGDPDKAWTVCSLRVFYKLLRDQAERIEARDKAKYADAPGIDVMADADAFEEEVLQTAPVVDTNAPMITGRVLKRSRVVKGPATASPASMAGSVEQGMAAVIAGTDPVPAVVAALAREVDQPLPLVPVEAEATAPALDTPEPSASPVSEQPLAAPAPPHVAEGVTTAPAVDAPGTQPPVLPVGSPAQPLIPRIRRTPRPPVG